MLCGRRHCSPTVQRSLPSRAPHARTRTHAHARTHTHNHAHMRIRTHARAHTHTARPCVRQGLALLVYDSERGKWVLPGNIVFYIESAFHIRWQGPAVPVYDSERGKWVLPGVEGVLHAALQAKRESEGVTEEERETCKLHVCVRERERAREREMERESPARRSTGRKRVVWWEENEGEGGVGGGGETQRNLQGERERVKSPSEICVCER
jgi:hypothetical protein